MSISKSVIQQDTNYVQFAVQSVIARRIVNSIVSARLSPHNNIYVPVARAIRLQVMRETATHCHSCIPSD